MINDNFTQDETSRTQIKIDLTAAIHNTVSTPKKEDTKSKDDHKDSSITSEAQEETRKKTPV